MKIFTRKMKIGDLKLIPCLCLLLFLMRGNDLREEVVSPIKDEGRDSTFFHKNLEFLDLLYFRC
jgi:hypothetical protein